MRTAFRRYEVFLKDVGVNLKYRTKTIPTIYSNNPDGGGWAIKIGRNDQCYCGSQKNSKNVAGSKSYTRSDPRHKGAGFFTWVSNTQVTVVLNFSHINLETLFYLFGKMFAP